MCACVRVRVCVQVCEHVDTCLSVLVWVKAVDRFNQLPHEPTGSHPFGNQRAQRVFHIMQIKVLWRVTSVRHLPQHLQRNDVIIRITHSCQHTRGRLLPNGFPERTRVTRLHRPPLLYPSRGAPFPARGEGTPAVSSQVVI